VNPRREIFYILFVRFARQFNLCQVEWRENTPLDREHLTTIEEIAQHFSFKYNNKEEEKKVKKKLKTNSSDIFKLLCSLLRFGTSKQNKIKSD
jgi:endo-1,4-beta-D-glucanase Y